MALRTVCYLKCLMSPFCTFVIYIIFVRAHPKMVGIYAGRHIAFVKNAETFWNWPYGPHIGYTVGEARSILSSANSSITVRVEIALE